MVVKTELNRYLFTARLNVVIRKLFQYFHLAFFSVLGYFMVGTFCMESMRSVFVFLCTLTICYTVLYRFTMRSSSFSYGA